jgi:integrase
MDIVASNSCDALERPRVQVATPRGLTADDIRRLIAVIPETPVGLRDRAIILTLTLTGRRRAEVLNMTVGDLTHEDGTVWYRYRGAEPCPTCGAPMVLDRSSRGWWLRCVAQGCQGKRDLGTAPGRAVDLLTRTT